MLKEHFKIKKIVSPIKEVYIIIKRKVLLSLLFIFFTILCLTSCVNKQQNETESKEEYFVSNDFFNYLGFEPAVLTYVNYQTNTFKKTPLIKILGSCQQDLFEIEINAKLYSKTGDLLGVYNQKEKQNIKATEEFNLSFEVEPTVQISTASAIVDFSGKSYEKPNGETIKKVTITFNYNNSKTNDYIEIKKGTVVNKPTYNTENPFISVVWCSDEKLTKQFDFSELVYENITLYAKYVVDYAGLTNKVTDSILKSNVKITVKKYNTFLGISSDETYSSSYGIIFSENGSYYYVLAINHATYQDPDYDKIKYTIEDYKGNTYEGFYKHGSASYGLSILYFSKENTQLEPINFASSNESENKEIITVSKKNIISYDTIVDYVNGPKLNCSERESNVTYSVIKNNKYASTGGILLNFDLKLIGLQYAYQSNTNIGYAIPISKIKQYLNNYFYE